MCFTEIRPGCTSELQPQMLRSINEPLTASPACGCDSFTHSFSFRPQLTHGQSVLKCRGFFFVCMCIHTDTDLPGQLGRNQWRWVIKGVSFHEEESEHMLSPEDIYPAVKPQKVNANEFFHRINICTRCRKDTVLQVHLMQQQSD